MNKKENGSATKWLEEFQHANTCRAINVQKLTIRIRESVLLVERLEHEISQLGSWFQIDAQRRPRSQKYISVSFQAGGTQDNPLQLPKGPIWLYRRKDDFQTINQPTTHQIRDIYKDEFFQVAKENKNQIRALSSVLIKHKKVLSKVYLLLKNVEGEGDKVDWPKRVSRLMPSHTHVSIHRRRKHAEAMIAKLLRVLRQFEDLDERINEAMRQFNRLGGRNNNLLYAWVPSRKTDNTLIGMSGPELYRLRISKTSRHKEPLGKTRLSKSLIEDSKQTRKETELKTLSAHIVALKQERDRLSKLIRSAFTSINSLPRESIQ